MSRHPYTHACDYIRSLGPTGKGGVVLSRCDASLIRQGIAKALGMDDEALAVVLSNFYQANQNEITEEQVAKVIVASIRGLYD